MTDAELGAALKRGYARVSQVAQEHGTDLATAAEAVAQHDRQQTWERELLAYAAQLTPQHVQHLAQLEASGGGAAVINALMQAGLSRGALEVAAVTYDSMGFGGLVQTVQGRLQESAQQAQAAAIETHLERAATKPGDGQATAQIKRDSPFIAWAKDPAVQKAAAAVCAKAGIRVANGQSPFSALLPLLRGMEGGAFVDANRTAPFQTRVSQKETIAYLAEMLGEDPKDVAALLDEVDTADHTHELVSRLAVGDKPRLRMTPEAARRERSAESRRNTLEAKYEEMDQPAARSRAPAARPSATSQARRPAPELRREALDRAYDAIDRGEEMPEAEPAAESESRRQLSQAYDRLEEEGEAA